MLSVFRTRNKEEALKAEQFNTAFKAYKKARKNKKSFTTLGNYFRRILGIDDYSLTQEKLQRYKDQLEACEQQILEERLPGNVNTTRDSIHILSKTFVLSSLKREEKLLRELIRLLECFLIVPNSNLAHIIEALEEHLRLYLSGIDISSLQALRGKAFVRMSENPVKRIVLIAKKIANSYILKIYQDRRYLFRTIIRFHFKNLDDVSGDERISVSLSEFFQSQKNILCNIRKQSTGSMRHLRIAA